MKQIEKDLNCSLEMMRAAKIDRLCSAALEDGQDLEVALKLIKEINGARYRALQKMGGKHE